MKKTIKDYFNPPWFDWFFKWEGISKVKSITLTKIVWKSQRTGRITIKVYNYQINIPKGGGA